MGDQGAATDVVLSGVRGMGGGTNSRGVYATGTGSAEGVLGIGGPNSGTGVSGDGGGTGGIGVQGYGGSATGVGVWGSGNGSGAGVVGSGGSSNGDGVHGFGTGAGSGVIAGSDTGIDLWCYGTGRLRQEVVAALPMTSGSTFVGEMVRTTDGSMYICTEDEPITWRRVVAQHASYAHAGGSVNLFAKAIRILDTRSSTTPLQTGGARLAANSVHPLQITGTAVDGVSVPVGAAGIIGTIGVAGATANGSVKAYPGAEPSGSVISYGSYLGTAELSDGIVVGLSGAGKVNIKCMLSAVHVALDIAGFIF